jgi:hypothetical protein
MTAGEVYAAEFAVMGTALGRLYGIHGIVFVINNIHPRADQFSHRGVVL